VVDYTQETTSNSIWPHDPNLVSYARAPGVAVPLGKHVDAILQELGLAPTIHEPCSYSGIIDGKRIIFMRQVDNFAIVAPDAHTADVLLNMLNDKLSIPLKRQGHLDMYNGVDIIQTRHYIRLSCTSFIN
jgi:hypothetical protein